MRRGLAPAPDVARRSENGRGEYTSSVDDVISSVYAGTFDTAVSAIVERARSGVGGYVVLCNLHVLMSARRDPRVLKALAGASYVMPDGAPIVRLRRRRGAAQVERTAGPDFMMAVIDAGRALGLRHMFVGSTEPVLEALVSRVSARLPGAEIAGTFSPRFGAVDELADGAAAVAACDADIVWVALGAPKQELWMSEHAAELAAVLMIGVGAAFEYHAGLKRRAPRVLRRYGLEWVYRLFREPRRLTGRYVWTALAFLSFSGSALIKRRAQ